MLRSPTLVPLIQRQQLRDVLAQAARAHKAGSLPLELHDGFRLTRLLRTLRALALATPPLKKVAAAHAGAGGATVISRPSCMSLS